MPGIPTVTSRPATASDLSKMMGLQNLQAMELVSNEFHTGVLPVQRTHAVRVLPGQDHHESSRVVGRPQYKVVPVMLM